MVKVNFSINLFRLALRPGIPSEIVVFDNYAHQAHVDRGVPSMLLGPIGCLVPM